MLQLRAALTEAASLRSYNHGLRVDIGQRRTRVLLWAANPASNAARDGAANRLIDSWAEEDAHMRAAAQLEHAMRQRSDQDEAAPPAEQAAPLHTETGHKLAALS